MIKGVLIFFSYLYLLPFLGFLCFHLDKLSYFFEFPPKTKYFDYKNLNFSFDVFFSYVFAIFLIVYFIYLKPVFRIKSKNFITLKRKNLKRNKKIYYPMWGYFGWFLLIVSWYFSWFLKENSFLRNNSFFPLWLGYIFVVNSFTYIIKGKSFIIGNKIKVISLFILSSIFWWSFEYLNRFTQNWVYITAQANINSLEYFIRGSICFSTVLPAVLSTAEFLFNFDMFNIYKRMKSIRINRNIQNIIFVLNGFFLFFIGVFPSIFYPFLWISPIIAFIYLKKTIGQNSLIRMFQDGDLKTPVIFSLASLICGFFWEFWNFYSIPKWKYDIPYLNGFHLFEMPIVGYAGYLPFGLECFCVLLLFNYINEKGEIKI